MKVTLILWVFSGSDVGTKWWLLCSLLHPTTKHLNRLIWDDLVFPCTGVDTMADWWSSPAVLNSSPRAPPLCKYCMSLLVNTPDSYNQLVRSALRAWTVFRLTCSRHSVHCSLLPEQGKSVEVYFTSEHSLMDLRCATSSRTDKCDIIYVCKYIQFKFTSRTLQFTMNGIRSLWTGIMEEYRVMSTSQGTYDRLEQTSEVIRVT